MIKISKWRESHCRTNTSIRKKKQIQKNRTVRAAFLIQIFLHRHKIANVNSEILSSRQQMSKSHWQICFLLLAHHQPTTLLRQAGNLVLESFGTLIFIMITKHFITQLCTHVSSLDLAQDLIS